MTADTATTPDRRAAPSAPSESDGRYVTSHYIEGGVTDALAARHAVHETAVDKYSRYYLVSMLINSGINTLRSPHADARLPLSGPLLEALQFFQEPARLEAFPGHRPHAPEDGALLRTLIENKFLFPASVDQDRCFNLLNVEIDTNTVCNQACTFCPVSIDPRKRDDISEAMFDDILEQVASLGQNPAASISIYLAAYNEITLDKRYPSFARKIREHGFQHTVISNGSNLRPQLVDTLLDLGIDEFVLNVPALDEETYFALRGTRDINRIVEHIDHLATTPARVTIIVHGVAGRDHDRNYRAMKRRFRDTSVTVTMGRTMDRAGNLDNEYRSTTKRASMHGCMNDGSRLINWIHVSAQGECFICPMDYYMKHKVGDLRRQSIQEVMQGDDVAEFRRYLHGLEEAPEQFICRSCMVCLPASWKETSTRDATPRGLYRSGLQARLRQKVAATQVFAPLYLGRAIPGIGRG